LIVPEPGQSPALAAVVVEVMCTVNGDAVSVVPAGTGSGPQGRLAARIVQGLLQPAPRPATLQSRPGGVGTLSGSAAPCASPRPSFQTVIVNPIWPPTLTLAASAVFLIWIDAALIVDVSPSSPHDPVDGWLFTSPE